MQNISLQIRRQDGSVEDVIEIGEREEPESIAARLIGLSDVYQGTGYLAVLVLGPGFPDTIVGQFGRTAS